MAQFDLNGSTHFIDNKLKLGLDKKIIPDLKRRDKDAVFIVDGKEGSGKSRFADSLGAYMAYALGTSYGLDNICMTPEEFRNRVMSSNKNDVVIYDEAHRGMGSRRALSEVNNILIDLMMEMRQKNLFVVIVLPTIFMLDRYPALYRAIGLFHIYELKRNRGYWVYFNDKNKKLLFILGKKLLDYKCMRWPKFRGRFFGKWVVNEEEYRLKKKLAFEDKPRITKAETFKSQRDLLLKILYKELNIKQSELLTKLRKYKFPINKTNLSDIVGKNRENTKNFPIPLAE